MVHADPATRKADGPHRKKLRTYLGIVACDKVDVTYKNWKQVHAAQKDLIWKDIPNLLFVRLNLISLKHLMLGGGGGGELGGVTIGL